MKITIELDLEFAKYLYDEVLYGLNDNGEHSSIEMDIFKEILWKAVEEKIKDKREIYGYLKPYKSA